MVKLFLNYARMLCCLKLEVKSHSRDSEGTIKFQKLERVDMFIITFLDNKESREVTVLLINHAREFCKWLNVPYKIVLYYDAAKKLSQEIFVWSRELSDYNNCLDYLARRLGGRYEQTKKLMIACNKCYPMLNTNMSAEVRVDYKLWEIYQTTTNKAAKMDDAATKKVFAVGETNQWLMADL